MNYELYTTKHWMILPSFVHGILPTLMYNSNNHIAISVTDKKKPYLVASGSGEVFRDSQVTEDGEVVPRYNWDGTSLLAQMKVPFVNVIPIDGPITRNGDACSYGSKDIRDWLMEAADNKFCRAHVLVVNTPGGSAWAKNDFQQAIDFAHSMGQRVYMLIDGLCASAGMYLASFCDEVYVVNLKDQLGCVGVMASFFTIKNGEKNQFDSETYHEYYATKSINKNKEYRDIAENDDATLLIAELDKLEDEFRKDMQAAFPDATDDHLDGKVFDASEVMGILCDGQMLLADVVGRAFAVASGDEEPIARTANRIIVAPDEDPEDDENDEDPMAAAIKNLEAAAKGVAAIASKNNISPKNSTTMTNEKYQKLAQLLGVDELVVTEEGTFLNTPLLNKLTEKLDEMEEKAAEAEAAQAAAQEAAEQPEAQEQPAPAAEEAPADEQPAEKEDPVAEEPAAEQPAAEEAPAEGQPSEEALQNAQADIDKIQETLHNAEQMIAEKDKEIAENAKTIEDLTEQLDAAKAELETAKGGITEKDAAIEAKDKTIEENAKAIAEKQAEIDKLTKQVADLKAEVKELSEKETPMVDAAAGVPSGNGTGEAPKFEGAVKSEISADDSIEDIRAKLRAKDEKQKTYRHK
jgi:protease-4